LQGVVLNRHQGIEGRYRSGYSGSYGAYGATEAAYGAVDPAFGGPEPPEPRPPAGTAKSKSGKKGDVAAL
jgi:hypothetical protein